MSEMLERVEKAIGGEMARQVDDEGAQWVGGADDATFDLAKIARVAIEAMREPTEGMMKAMQESGVFDEVNGMISFCDARGSHPGGLKTPPMPAAYTVMIGAALAPTVTAEPDGAIQKTSTDG